MGFTLLILATIFIPTILFFLIGRAEKSNPKKEKLFYIAGIVYLIVGFGVCGKLLINI